MVLFFLTSFQERIQLETSRLYRQAGVNPLAGSPSEDHFPLHLFCFLPHKLEITFYFMVFFSFSFFVSLLMGIKIWWL